MGVVLEKLPGIVERFPGGSVAITTLDQAINLSRSNSLWPLMFGTKCCAIEMLMATGAAHHDLARFGAEVARASVRQADLMVIATGSSQRHIATMAEHLLERLKRAGFAGVRAEGTAQSDWVLIDAGDVIVHLFKDEVRHFYDLEKLWGAALPESATAIRLRA